MAGTWASPNVTLDVSHTLDGTCGLLAAHGVNAIADRPWDLMVFTGSVTQIGKATVDVHLFSSKNHPKQEQSPKRAPPCSDRRARSASI